MSNLIALEHRADPEHWRVAAKVAEPAVDWSPRRRLIVLAGCILGAWLLFLIPFLIFI